MNRLVITIISIFFILNNCDIYSQELSLKYKVKSSLGLSSDKQIPFWISNGYEDSYTQEGNTFGYLKASFFADYKHSDSKKPDLSFGCSVKSDVNDKVNTYFQQLYAGLRLQKFELLAGMNKKHIRLEKLSSTNGDFLYSDFSRPYPQLALSTEYINIPFTKDWFSFRVSYSEGMLLGKRGVKNARVHHKTGYLKLSNSPQWYVAMGLHHYVLWGGTSTNPKYGKLPTNLKAYLDIILAKDNSEYDPLSVTDANNVTDKNRLGNHLGMIDLQLFYAFKKLLVRAYRQVIFEDSSGMNLFNRDALMGAFIKIKKSKPWLQAVLYEFYTTSYQSGDTPGGSAKPQGGVWTGRDNYFNHSVYSSGWTHFGSVIGTPFFTAIQTEKFSSGISNNRITANHFGLSGFAFNKLPYRFVLSYVQNYGTYSNSFDKKQLSGMFEIGILEDIIPFDIYLGMGSDLGEYTGDKIGMYFIISKSGLF